MQCHLHRLPILPKSPENAPIRARENCNQSIALRKCDSQTDVVRVTRRGLLTSPPSAAAPFAPATALQAFGTGASLDNCASILSLHYSVKSIITQDFSVAIANFSNLPGRKGKNPRQCIQKSGESTRTAPCSTAQAAQRSKPKQSPPGAWASPLRRKRAPLAARYARMGAAG